MNESQLEQASALVRDFVREVPEAESVLEAHLEDNFDDLLPHVLMADLTRWIIGLQREADAGNAEAGASRDRALAFLELRFADVADVGARDVIAASFLENLHQAGSDRKALLGHLGPTLSAALSREQ
jgi:hypothetical protein